MLLDIFYNVIVSFSLGVCSCHGIPGHLCCPFAFLVNTQHERKGSFMVEIIIAAVVAIVVGFLIGYFLMQKVLRSAMTLRLLKLRMHLPMLSVRRKPQARGSC